VGAYLVAKTEIERQVNITVQNRPTLQSHVTQENRGVFFIRLKSKDKFSAISESKKSKNLEELVDIKGAPGLEKKTLGRF